MSMNTKGSFYSDTNFQLANYDAHNLSIAEEINPGRFDVRPSSVTTVWTR